MARPTIDLDWAETYAVDPTSGQGNRVAYPAAWQDDGWSLGEKPPRNYDNQFKWLTGQWIKYLDTAIARGATYIVAASDASAESKAHADAVCDGTDDHAEINAAITAVASGGSLGISGGVVLLTEGTFTIDATIALASGVHIVGRGMGATIIEVDTGSITPFVMLTGSSDTRQSVCRLTLDGNAASVAGTYGGIILTTCSHIQLVELEIKEVSGSSGNTVDVDGSTQVFIARCEIDNNEGTGLLINNSAHSVHVENCYFSGNNLEIKIDTDNCVVGGCTLLSGVGAGMNISGNYNLVQACNIRGNTLQGIILGGNYNQISNCSITGNGNDGASGKDGISLSSADANLITNCVISMNYAHGIGFTASDDNIVRGCYIHSNSQDTDNTSSGINFDATSTTNVITDNVFRLGAGAKQQYAGIDLTTNTLANRIYGNDCYNGGASATIDVSGPGSAKTIPAWTGSNATTNVLDNVVNANRTVI